MTGGDGARRGGPDEPQHPLSGLRTGAQWVQVCVELAEADGAAVIGCSRRSPDARRILHSTNTLAARTADVLYMLGEGPDTAAMADGNVHTVLVDDPDHRRRWPVLVDELDALDVKWVGAYPIGPVGDPSGTVQLHRRTPPTRRWPGSIDTFVAHLVRAFGTDLLDAHLLRELTDPEVASPTGADYGNVNVTIGVLAARHHLTVAQASAMLRGCAYADGATTTDQARRILDTLDHPGRHQQE